MPTEKRAEFLARQLDAEIRFEVENLLAAHENADGFIDQPLLIEQGLAEDETTDNLIGRQIEDYLIRERIGAGGMGAVYLAERVNSDFKHKVALKLIKRGMDSEAILKRFATERRILSTLQHPNIATLLDGGISSDGLPFFVMEYVDGKPLNQFCRENNINLKERLEIFRKICAAVEHAHQNLIVHRDLKPSNILVTKNGVPKLLDFGIAKLLSDEDSETTATHGKMLTPEYASPEQILGKTVTTAADVYSLGVVLYELLSDHRPFEVKGKTFEEIVRSVCETDPPKPSATGENQRSPTKNSAPAVFIAKNQLRGDLDNIVLKALRKEPMERYGSVQQFSADISRFLRGLPVLARPQTLSYRFGKYFNRHKVGVLTSLLVLLSLIGGASVATWQAIVARRERVRAEMRFNQVRKLANTVLFDYHERIKDLPGATETRKKLVTDALEYLDNLAQTSDNVPDLQRELALAYRKVAQIQNGYESSGNTGETGASLANYRKALLIQEKVVSDSSATDVDRRTLAKLYLDVEEGFPEAIAILTALAEKNPNNAEAQADLANGLWSLAKSNRAGGNYDEAINNYLQAGSIYEKLAAAGTDKRASYLRNAALVYKNIGGVFEQKDDFSKTLEMYRRALAIDAENAQANPNNAQYQLDLSFSYNSIASGLANRGDSSEALNNCQQALIIQEKIVAADPQNSFAQSSLARTLRRVADNQRDAGDTNAAIINYQKSIQMFETLTRADPDNSQKQSNLADVYASFARLKIDKASNLKNVSEKKTWLREAEGLQQNGLNIFEKLKRQNALDKWSEELFLDLQAKHRKLTEELAKLTIK